MTDFLQSLVPWGTQIILWAQTLRSGFLDAFFLAISQIGSTYGSLLLVSVLYWCVDRSLGRRLGLLVLGGSLLNSWIKLAFHIPRPADPGIVPLEEIDSPSFPSGHTHNAIATFGYLAYRSRLWWAWVVVLVVTILVAFSRLYRGVHFPQDLIGGFLIGAVTLAAFILWSTPVLSALRRLPFSLQLILAVLVPLAVMLLQPGDLDGTYPAHDAVQLSSAMAGCCLGWLIEMRYVRFRLAHGGGRRLLCLLAGALLAGVIFGAFKGIGGFLPAEGGWLFRWLRYGCLGFGVAAGAPWLFVRLRLTESELAR